MRRALLTMLVTAALLVSALPASAHHPFGGQAGFDKARFGAGWSEPGRGPRESIRVWKPDHWGLKLNAALNDWNDAAGWNLFDRVFNKANADVVLADAGPDPYAPAWTVCLTPTGDFDVYAAYGSCTVYLYFHGDDDSATGTTKHELGHTLGFADHLYAQYYNGQVTNNPRVCDDPNHPAYHTYNGVMSYCQFGPGDVVTADAKMLYRHDYRDTAP